MVDFIGTPGADRFVGTAGDDWATGQAGNDTLSGAGGNDVLAGGVGADSLDGGLGDDFLFAGAGLPKSTPLTDPIPYMDRGTEKDTLSGGDGMDVIFAGYGDVVDGGVQPTPRPGGRIGDLLYLSLQGAGAGVTANFAAATLTIGGGAIKGIEFFSWIEGSKYGDRFTLGSNVSIVMGMEGDDVITTAGTTSAPQIYGGAGNDTIDARTGHDSIIDGGDGNDTIYSSGIWTDIKGGAGNDIIQAYALAYGGSGNDSITLTAEGVEGQFAFGGDGDDTLTASAFGNRLSGGAGADILKGGAAIDRLYSAGLDDPFQGDNPPHDMGLERDQLTGGGGDDFLAAGYGDNVDGGEGWDFLRLSFGGLGAGITFNTASILSGKPFTLGGGTIQNIEELRSLRGTEFNDTLTIAAATSPTRWSGLSVDGGGGNDTIILLGVGFDVNGGAGNDTLVSSAGTGGSATDFFTGGDGLDTVDYSKLITSLTLDLATGENSLGNQLYSIEGIIGSRFDDRITGDAGANVLNGGAGADTMVGGAGNDTYYVDNIRDVVTETSSSGGVDTVSASVTYTLGRYVEKLTLTGSATINATGNELANTIVGNAGQNRITGGAGADTLTGGSLTDTFVYTALSTSTLAASDLITDLVDTTDRIDLSVIDGDTSRAGVQGFHIVDAFTKHAGELLLSYNATTRITSLTVDVNGDGVADMLIRMSGDHHDFDRFIFGGG